MSKTKKHLIQSTVKVIPGIRKIILKLFAEHLRAYKVKPTAFILGPTEYISFKIDMINYFKKTPHLLQAYDKFGVTNYRGVPVIISKERGIRLGISENLVPLYCEDLKSIPPASTSHNSSKAE